jgi:hypothetical protein
MQFGKRPTVPSLTSVRALVTGFLLLTLGTQAASLQTFSTLFQQLTNDITIIQQNFDGSTDLKQKLAVLTRARGLVLKEELRDDQVLARLIPLLNHDTNYSTALDTSAVNARATVLARHDLIGTRVADLPPSSRANAARILFTGLADEHAALIGAEHAAAISNLLAPFGSKLESVAALVAQAQIMPRPRTGLNSLRASVNGRRFKSTGNGRNSPNLFEVTAPSDFYRTVTCRGVDGAGVIHISLPVLTEQVRYEIATGLAAISYSPDVFATNAAIITATNGTVFVQSDGREVYGVFTCEGPGLEIKEGRFRVQLPRGLRD